MKIDIKSLNNWGNAGNGSITILNDSSQNIIDWEVSIKLNNFQIKELWNMNFTKNGDVYKINPKSWQKNT